MRFFRSSGTGYVTIEIIKNRHMKTVAKITKTFKTELKNIYPDREIQSFLDILLQYYANMNKTEVFLNPEKELFPETVFELKIALQKLKQEIPVQYIIGETVFYGLPIKVTSDVLIPRPETEELVDLIVENHKKNQNINILDMGTGSGCIAVALKKYLPEAHVFAMDISEDALKIANDNAAINQTEIHFFTDDILNPQNKYDFFNVIVSNPPYVRESEKELMKKNVLDNEPHLALFVKDDDALIFYRKIIDFAKAHLKPEGFIYFEINEALGRDAAELLNQNAFKNIQIIKDIFGKERMLMARF